MKRFTCDQETGHPFWDLEIHELEKEMKDANRAGPEAKKAPVFKQHSVDSCLTTLEHEVESLEKLCNEIVGHSPVPGGEVEPDIGWAECYTLADSLDTWPKRISLVASQVNCTRTRLIEGLLELIEDRAPVARGGDDGNS